MTACSKLLPKLAVSARRAPWFGMALLFAAALPVVARDSGVAVSRTPDPAPHVSAVRSGAIPARDGQRLLLTADAGTIRIFSDANGEVRYRVIVEAEASDPAASKRLERFLLAGHATPAGVALTGQMPGQNDAERVWVTYEVHVPVRYSLQVSTQAGDITTQNVDGQVMLSTGGGNIRTGNIGGYANPQRSRAGSRSFMARLDTAGGHIVVGNVAGSLRASTAGGHITAGNIDGDAILQSGGGHVHVGRVAGAAQLSTGGGDIVAERANDGATAATGGGRIEFGEAAGAIQARTKGGGVRIDRITGPTELNSSDGGVVLTGVRAPLHASTQNGAITASFSPLYGQVGLSDESNAENAATELASIQGDVTVFLPRKMAVTIDAQVAQGGGHRIVADSSMPLRISDEISASGPILHGQCELNGGGRVLHLRTASGNIHLRLVDANPERDVATQHPAGAEPVPPTRAENATGGAGVAPNPNAPEPEARGSADANAPSAFEEIRRRFEGFWSSAISVSPEEEQRHLLHSDPPEYPEIARRAGVEGDVTLRVVIGKDGAVADVAAISGEPVLARAAMEAVGHWSYAPALLGGRPIGVVTTVTLAFRLR